MAKAANCFAMLILRNQPCIKTVLGTLVWVPVRREMPSRASKTLHSHFYYSERIITLSVSYHGRNSFIKVEIFRLLLKATVTERRLAEGYWLIIASCKNVMASDFQNNRYA